MKNKTLFVCTECGYQSAKWYGKCPSCNEWNTLDEQTIEEEVPKKNANKKASHIIKNDSSASKISDVKINDTIRTITGINEFDRVLGGGIVNSSVVLIAGEPGIGKSTLLLQVCAALGALNSLLYISGEESQGQIKMRAKRLGIDSENLYLYTQTEINDICAEIDVLNPDLVIIDSIQTMNDEDTSSAPGTVSQIRNSTHKLIQVAKNSNCAIIIVGHVNKDGAIAGPKILEHMVAPVL